MRYDLTLWGETAKGYGRYSEANAVLQRSPEREVALETGGSVSSGKEADLVGRKKQVCARGTRSKPRIETVWGSAYALELPAFVPPQYH